MTAIINHDDCHSNLRQVLQIPTLQFTIVQSLSLIKETVVTFKTSGSAFVNPL